MADLAAELAAAQTHLATAKQAELDALEAQEIRFQAGGSGLDRSETMADLGEIRRSINFWTRRIASLQARINGQPTLGGLGFTSARFGDYTS